MTTRCQCLTLAGEQCKKNAIKGTNTCYIHANNCRPISEEPGKPPAPAPKEPAPKEPAKPPVPGRTGELCYDISLSNDPGKWYDLSSLICSTSANLNIVDLLDTIQKCPMSSSCDPCVLIGRKIANSLIKIAALRIFAEPEQSILELPVNSIDAYNPTQKIGKFGMGFFSMLYWLIGHPERSLTINSTSLIKNSEYCSYIAKIAEKNGVLSFNIITTPLTSASQTGTTIILQDNDNNLPIRGFEEQLYKLKYSKGAKIVISVDYMTGRIVTY